MSAPLDLRCGAMTCRLDPALGGAVLALRHAGRDVLRSVDQAADVLAAAAFPLVPFANRIDHGRFSFAGRTISLAVDAAAAPHALHGEGWRSAWRVEAVFADRAILAFAGGADPAFGWPWRYRAHQHVQVTDDALLVELAVTNCEADRAMPLGLGWHPYVPRRADTTVSAMAATMWRTDPSRLARAAEPSTLFTGAPVPIARLDGLDNFFACIDPAAIVRGVDAGGGGVLGVQGQGAGFQLYVPPGERWFCLEPVSHSPNAFGRGEFARADLLGAGETRRQCYAIRILADPSDQGAP